MVSFLELAIGPRGGLTMENSVSDVRQCKPVGIPCSLAARSLQCADEGGRHTKESALPRLCTQNRTNGTNSHRYLKRVG